MDEFELDKTRKSIQLNELSKVERDKLFDRFTQIGGKVIKEKSVKKQPEKKRSRSRKPGQKPGKKQFLPASLTKRNLTGVERDPKTAKIKEKAEQIKEEELSSSNFRSLLGLRLRAKSAGIASFRGHKVNPIFLSDMIRDLRYNCTNLKAFAYELLSDNNKLEGQLLASLRQKNPMYTQLIKKSVEIYQKDDAATLMGSTSMGEKIYLKNIKEPVFSIVRKIYCIKFAQEIYIEGVCQALQIVKQSPQKTERLEILAKGAQSSWIKILTKIYDNLVLLAQRTEMKNVTPNSMLFEKMIGVKVSDKLISPKQGAD